jgi:hypothetical protein
MDIYELKQDILKVDSSTPGAINASWSAEGQWWVGIFQDKNGDTGEPNPRVYTYTYECCENNSCGLGVYESFCSLEELFKNKKILESFTWRRCQ